MGSFDSGRWCELVARVNSYLHKSRTVSKFSFFIPPIGISGHETKMAKVVLLSAFVLSNRGLLQLSPRRGTLSTLVSQWKPWAGLF
jgi:hypothetical protein